VFAAHGVSIEEVRQSPLGQSSGPLASLVVITHAATDADLQATVGELAGLDVVDSIAGVIRVEGA
jgi:homoserine dehydrogenase